MADLDTLLRDLRAESDDLERVVAPLDQDEWRTPTPAEGWTIAHQIAHLAWTDDAALSALADPADFERAYAQPALAAFEGDGDPVGEAAATGAEVAPRELVEGWQQSRDALERALWAAAASGRRVPWFGPPMSVASMITARLMETWAHGQDVADALSVVREPTDRLRHVAHLGVRTRDFAYAVRAMPPPEEEFRVEITAPDGQLWTWGPAGAPQRITAPALDFALLVTQRRHVDDLEVTAQGADAAQWLTIAQAFAGPPGSGREKGQFA